MQHTTSAHNPAIARVVTLHAQCQVLFEFLFESVVDVARSAELTFLAEERRIVDGKEHRHGRFVDSNGGQRFGVFEIADSIADFKVIKTYHRTDVARRHRLSLLTAHTLEGVYLLDLRFFERTIAVSNRTLHALGNGATVNATHSDTSGVV